MLALELKQTDRIDIATPLKAHCKSAYGSDHEVKMRPFLDKFNSLRSEVASLQGRGGYETSRKLLKEYLFATQLLEQRFPVGDGKGGVLVRFTWADGFRPKVKASLPSLPYERACIVYNIASIESLMGRAADRSNAEGIKEAIKHFQTAAGILSLLRDQLTSSIVGATTPDLSEPALSMCVSYLLAQAQSCFYEKAVKDRLNRTLLSKLACQTAQFYSSALNFSQQIAGSIDASWSAHFRLQEMAFLCASHYQNVLAQKEVVAQKSEGYGALIARLKLADGLCGQAVQLAQQTGVQVNLASLHASIKSELASLEKDNNAIYLEIVPPPSTLPPLEMVASVKAAAVTLQDISEPMESASQAFDRLVPMDVRSKGDEYNTKLEGLVKDMNDSASKQTETVQKFLVQRGLPFAVDAQQEGLPESLWQKVQQIQVKGGMVALNNTLEALDQMAQDAGSQLSELEKKLREESEQDKQCRDRFKGSWTRLPSDNLNGNFLKSIEGYKAKLQVASSANTTVRQKTAASQPLHQYFSKSKGELEAAVPQSTHMQQDSPAKQGVRQALAGLEEGVKEMQKCVEEGKKTILADNITGELMKSKQRGEPLDAVLTRELPKHDVHKARVQQSVDRVQQALNAVGQAWEGYRAAAASGGDSRTEYLKNMESAASQIIEAFNDSAEGVGFFNRLLDYLRTLRQQIDDFVFARSEERGDLLGSVSRQLAGVNLNAGNANAPNPYTGGAPPPSAPW